MRGYERVGMSWWAGTQHKLYHINGTWPSSPVSSLGGAPYPLLLSSELKRAPYGRQGLYEHYLQ